MNIANNNYIDNNEPTQVFGSRKLLKDYFFDSARAYGYSLNNI